jgi:hypothetical protein
VGARTHIKKTALAAHQNLLSQDAFGA